MTEETKKTDKQEEPLSKVTEAEIRQFQKMSEAQFIGALFQDTDLFFDYDNMLDVIKDKENQETYKLLRGMLKHNLTKIDEFTTDKYVESKSKAAQETYKRYRGWDGIFEKINLSDVEDVHAYYSDILKYNTVVALNKDFHTFEKWNTLSKLSYEQILDYFESKLDNASIVDDAEDRVGDIKSGISQMIEDADKGANKGFPVDSPILNGTINGQVIGNITMFAGASGSGKTTIAIAELLPPAIEYSEPLLIMCNEEDMSKWQRELVTWVINNIVTKEKGSELKGESFIKSRFYQGNFSKIEWKLLRAANKWIDEKVEDGLITFVSFTTFSMNKAIKLIKKHSKRGVKYFIIDTLKLDNDTGSKVTDQSWLQLQQNMVKLYNVIKPTSRNVHVWVTYQLSKSKARYLDQSMLGISKNVADVVSTLILSRKVLVDEKSGGKNELRIDKADGSRAVLDSEKDYRILFIDKNRTGSTSKQIVLETDLGKNTVKDVGYTLVPEDY